MRAKRALMVVSLLVSLVAGGSFGALAFLDSSSRDGSSDPTFGENGFGPAPTLDRDVGTAADERVEDASATGLFLWIGAIVSSVVFLVSATLFRLEVRKEKDSLRAKKQRADYYKELRKYNAQLKGPPKDNT
ncbi:MAG: hypothetical protein HYT80_05310 [Euryarchaeota archaeon]|nr:hypothetical protein [Euryarchaeota archaeon]